jgi:uncharacterized BrkB/YihY/UPF0761 family membrane protein
MMGRLLRWLVIAAVLAGVVFLLFTVVFPWVDERLVNDPVMGGVAALV